MNVKVNIKWIVSVIIVAFLSLIVLNHFFKDLFKLNPYYRNKILLEGFDASVTDASGANASVTDASGNVTATPSGTAIPSVTDPSVTNASGTATTTTATPSVTNASGTATPSGTANEIPDTDKSTIMVDLFEKVNTHMDVIRTIKLSDKLIPINIDKSAAEPYAILANLKLLINNGIYKNEIDLKEMYDKYIGNKSIQVLTSDINSVNMESTNTAEIGSLETSFLKRCQSIVAAHQTVIDKILENKSKE
jgi:hypothetical protein